MAASHFFGLQNVHDNLDINASITFISHETGYISKKKT